MAKEIRIRRSEAPAEQDPGATDEAIAGVYPRPKSRRAGKLKIKEADKSAITIKVTTQFKQKLQTYCQVTKSDAGEWLESKVRRELDERVTRIVGAWTFLGSENDPPALPSPEPTAA